MINKKYNTAKEYARTFRGCSKKFQIIMGRIMIGIERE
jgi:hypothetical protein